MRFFTPPHLRRLTGFARPAHSAPPRLPCAPRPFRNRAFWRGSPAGMRDCVLVRAVATITPWVTASVRRSKRPVDLTRLGRGFSSRLAAQLLIRAELDRSRHRPEELVISACRPRCRVRGAGGTSCHRPFPGRPGLSQPCSQRTVSGRCAATVLSRNKDDHAHAPRIGKQLFCTTSAPPEPVNNLGAIRLTGYSQRPCLAPEETDACPLTACRRANCPSTSSKAPS